MAVENPSTEEKIATIPLGGGTGTSFSRMKHSRTGREGGVWGLEAFFEVMAVSVREQASQRASMKGPRLSRKYALEFAFL
ncbi:MAG: hypothetical protein AB8B60_10375 [Sulfitobacter sp.]